jgi:hypothetical protein
VLLFAEKYGACSYWAMTDGEQTPWYLADANSGYQVRPAACDPALRQMPHRCGIPVGMDDRISQVLLESDGQGYLRRIVMDELDGSRTEFQLRAQRENLPIEDTEIRFRPPAGESRGTADRPQRPTIERNCR